jgi:hypothetical protein
MIPMRNHRSFDLFELLGGECENPLIAFANYEFPAINGTITSTYRSAGIAWAVARRFQVYELEFGQAGTPSTSDVQVEWDVTRLLTAGIAGTTVVSNALDTADVASATLCMNQVTTEGTATGAGAGLNLKHWGINQRGSYRWRALDDGDNIVVASTTGTAITLRQQSTALITNLSATGNISFVER